MGYAKPLWKVIWPEGEPDSAVATGGPIERFWFRLIWSLRGKRTRAAWPVSPADKVSPSICARRCERSIAR